jgi:hypothetical protein
MSKEEEKLAHDVDRLDMLSPPPFEQDHEIVNNILPSYHMFQATISKTLRPSNEDFRVDPPTYEVTPVTSATATPLCLSTVVSPSEERSTEFFPLVEPEYNEENVDIWENTILANVHKIPNLAKRDNPVSNNLQIDIKVTKEVCQKGLKPEIIDPTNYEYKQGDYIHGYVTFTNTSDTPIAFEMVYVVFEGTLVVLENKHGLIDTEKPASIYKFLNMLDLFASWSYANIDRLITDNGDPHDWCEGETDPYDNTMLAMDLKRLFLPGITYKRYFTFRVPEKLLDDSCDIHNIASHTEVPPTIGIPRNSIPPSILLANKDFQIRDFSFVDSSISYSVDARVIGKASDYKYETPQDQYVVANEEYCPIRVVPKVTPASIYNRGFITQECDLYYRAFVDSIREKIQFGHDLLNVPSDRRQDFVALTPVSSRSSRSSRTTKLRQLYEVADSAIKLSLKESSKLQDNVYQYLTTVKKKSLTGSSKVLGILSLATPKQSYSIDYIPPPKFQTRSSYNTQIKIPVELTYYVENDGHKSIIPEVKSLQSELIVLTLRSSKYLIPIHVTHDMCIQDQEIDTKKREVESFDTIVVKQFKQYLQDLTYLIKSVGNDLLKLESQLYRDIKALATLSSKYMNLSIKDSNMQIVTKSATGHGTHSKLNTMSWTKETTDTNKTLYSKKFELRLDVRGCYVKGAEKQNSEQITLVPSFQTCLMARIYYIRITVKLTNGESLFINVPLTIQNE